MPLRWHLCRPRAFVAFILSISSITVVVGAPAQPVIMESTTGESLVILRRNELDTSHTFGSMLLLSEPRTLAEGRKACLEFGEELLSSSSSALQDLPFLLQSHSTPAIRAISSVWIAKDLSRKCQSFDVHLSQVQQTATCETLKLPVVCSSKNNDGEVGHKNPFFLETPAGPVVGTRDANSFRFLGIPYAKPPVGLLRFKSPQPADPFTTPLDATKFGSACPQNSPSEVRDRLNRATSSEDCLFLNVFTPVVTRNSRSHGGIPNGERGRSAGGTGLAAVIVYLHGGGFADYASSMVYFEPGNLVSRSGVVFVSFNYRLGLFGTMESVDQIPRSILPGNQAFRDQILALQWVQKNIAAFGGDPNQVTVMGESAGAVGIRALLSIPESFPLYRSVISQSDAPGLPFNPPRITSGIVGTFVIKSLNCSELASTEAVFDCLTSKTTAEIMATQRLAIQHQSQVDPHYQTLLLFSPTIDGDLLKDQFQNLLSDHSSARVQNEAPPSSWGYNTAASIIWGSTADEVGVIMGTKVIPVSGFDAFLRSFFHDSRTNKFESWPGYRLDPSNPDTVRITTTLIADDDMFHCPLQTLTENIAQTYQNNLFTYRLYRGRHIAFTKDDYCSVPGTHRTCHFDDVVPSLGSAFVVDELNRTQTGDDARLSRILIDRFTTFAKTGNPNPDPNPNPAWQPNLVAAANPDLVGSIWPSYNPSSMALFDINLQSQARPWIRRPTCQWLEENHLYFEV